MIKDKHIEKIFGSRRYCADLYDMSVQTLDRVFIKPGLVTLVDLGARGDVIRLSQLAEAVARKEAEQAADPSLKTVRSGAAKLKKDGRKGNPWGCKGKPADVAAAERRAVRR